MPKPSRLCHSGSGVLLCVVVALLTVATAQATWAANKFSAIRVDERTAHFNMYAGSFLIPEPVFFSADYEYDGSQGWPVYVGVEVHRGGSRHSAFGYVPFKINTGQPKGRAKCRVSTVADRMPTVTSPISTNQIVFKMYKAGGGAFYTKAFDLDCIWPKPFADITRADIAAVDTTSVAPSPTRKLAPRTSKIPKPKTAAATAKTAAAAKRPTIKVRQMPALGALAAAVTVGNKLGTNRFNVGMKTQWIMLVGKTNANRYFAALCEHRSSSDLYLREWKVFATNGSVHRQGTNTRVRRTYTIDLDSGATASNTKDLWWEFDTETKRYITPRNGTKIAVVYLRHASYDLASPPTKKIFLELDKIQGADWAPYVIDRNSKKNSLQSIYASGGFDLQLYSDEGNIPDLKAGGSYSRADLDSFFDAHYNASGPSGYWHMHGAMLTRYSGGYLGLMYRTGDRKGFAVFSSSFSSGSTREAKLLRTTAHELGHAVNLFHSDGDANNGGVPVAGQGHTVMNQTWTLASDWGYEWHTNSLNHLNSHPINRIQPGTAYGFNECISSHQAQF